MNIFQNQQQQEQQKQNHNSIMQATVSAVSSVNLASTHLPQSRSTCISLGIRSDHRQSIDGEKHVKFVQKKQNKLAYSLNPQHHHQHQTQTYHKQNLNTQTQSSQPSPQPQSQAISSSSQTPSQTLSQSQLQTKKLLTLTQHQQKIIQKLIKQITYIKQQSSYMRQINQSKLQALIEIQDIQICRLKEEVIGYKTQIVELERVCKVRDQRVTGIVIQEYFVGRGNQGINRDCNNDDEHDQKYKQTITKLQQQILNLKTHNNRLQAQVNKYIEKQTILSKKLKYQQTKINQLGQYMINVLNCKANTGNSSKIESRNLVYGHKKNIVNFFKVQTLKQQQNELQGKY